MIKLIDKILNEIKIINTNIGTEENGEFNTHILNLYDNINNDILDLLTKDELDFNHIKNNDIKLLLENYMYLIKKVLNQSNKLTFNDNYIELHNYFYNGNLQDNYNKLIYSKQKDLQKIKEELQLFNKMNNNDTNRYINKNLTNINIFHSFIEDIFESKNIITKKDQTLSFFKNYEGEGKIKESYDKLINLKSKEIIKIEFKGEKIVKLFRNLKIKQSQPKHLIKFTSPNTFKEVINHIFHDTIIEL